MNTVRTFIIADNQDVTRVGIRGYITMIFEECRIVDVTSKKELIQALCQQPESIVVLDYTLFDLTGPDDLLIVLQRFPEARWILFSNELSEDFIRRLSVERQVGMVLKDNSGDEIRSALLCAASGERFFCHQVTNLLLSAVPQKEERPILTAAETEVLKLIAQGKSVKEIAAERNSSIHTIITHKKNIFRKLKVNNVYEATKYALRTGLVEMVEYYI